MKEVEEDAMEKTIWRRVVGKVVDGVEHGVKES